MLVPCRSRRPSERHRVADSHSPFPQSSRFFASHFATRLARGWLATACLLGLALSLAAGTAAAQNTLPTVSVSDAEAYEDGRFVHFEVSLSQASSEQVTVEVATSSGTARSGTDFRAVLQTVTFPARSTDPQSVLVSLRNDRTLEPDETFTVALRNPVGATLGDATATGTIRNDDSAATLAASGIGETSATLTLGGHTGGWWYKGGEYALGPLGYSGQAYRILRRNVHSCTAVAAGTAAVGIGGLLAARSHDYRAYSDSTCSTRLARVKFRTLAPEGTPTVSISDAEVSEDGKWMEFHVSLSQASRERVTVEVATSSGTATSGADFRRVSRSRTLVFPANDGTPQNVRVLVHDDEEPEPDETFTVTLRNPRGATLGDATATGTIKDDGDTAATLAAGAIEDTTATLTIGGHTGGWWYKGNVHACTAVAAGTTAVSIGGLTTVTDYEYTAYSDSGCSTRLARTKFKTLAPEGAPTVSISDAEVVEGGDVIFAVSLSHPSRERVTVEVHMSSGTATSWYDFAAQPQTLTFHADRSQITRYARVKALDDEEPEPDETFTATLRVPVGATLGDATATGTIRDDGDTAATLTASDIEDTTATLTISGHTGGWWYRGGNADLCTAVAAGATSVSVSGLTTVTDYDYTAYSDSTCRTKLARVEFGTLAPEGTPTVSISDAEAYEDGTWISFKVSLSHPSRKRVFVRTNTSNGTATGTHGDFGPGIDFRHEFPGMGVIFEANSPVTTKSRGVIVYDDQDPEPDETFTVTLSHPSNVTLGDATATGTIRDDSDTAARLTASDIEDTTATLTISGHTGGWWYHGDAHSCTAVAAGATAVSIGGLTTSSSYDYTAYSDSGCSTKLARVEFRTIAPAGMPTVSISDAAASEDYSTIRFKVSLSHPSREPVRVWYETSGGTATSGTDFRATSYHYGLPANSWNREYTIDVHLVDDQMAEPDETFTLTLTKATGATLGDATATGTIVDDGDTTTTLAASDIEDTTATLTIAGHTDGWWYKGNAHACTAVAAGTTAVGISGLTAVTDYEYTAYSGSGCSTKLAEVEFRTLAPEGTPTVSVSDAEVFEDGAWMQFWVSLSQPSREPVTVDVQTSGGTATSGTDFVAVSRTLTLPANSREPELVPVPVHDDQEREPDETFTLTLSNPAGATLGDATATGTIRDDNDTAATLVASDIEDTTATLTVGGHTDGWWYKGNVHACTAVAAGTTAVSVSGLTAVTDYKYTAYSGSGCSTKLAEVEFRTLAPEGTPTVSVSDAEAYEDGWSVNFEVSLSQPSREQVTVEFATSSGTATMGTDFKGGSLTLTFPPNRKDPRRVSVRLIDDLEREPDETFTVTLTNPVGATLGNATATGTIRNDDTAATLAASGIGDTTATLTISGHTDGWWYKGNDWIGIESPCTAVAAGTTAVSIGGLTAAIRYDYRAYSDSTCTTRLAKVRFRTLAPEGIPTVSVSDAEVSEDSSWITFDVSLSHSSREPVTVHFLTSGGTATSGTDFGAVSQTLTFPANSPYPTKTVDVSVNDDQEPESDETFTVTLRNPVGATLGDATATGTIRDDGDTAATLTPSDIEDTTATLTIGGHTDGWWYRGRSSGTSSPWGACTAVAAGTTAVGITGLTAVTDYEYFAYSDSVCSTKLANVEFGTLAPEGTPTVSISDAELSEDGGYMQFKVSLSQPSRERVTVWYVVWGGTATGGTDFGSPRGNFVSFSANSSDLTASADVRLIDDQEPEPDETFTVTLMSPRNATLGDARATGTILDDGDTAARLTASDIEDTTATLTISGHTEGWWYTGRSTGTSSPWGGCTAVTAGTTAVGISGLVPVATHEYRAFSDSGCSTKLARVEFRTIAPAGMPTVSISDAAASEDYSTIRFKVSLSHPSREPVRVWYETSGGTATSGTDFRATSYHYGLPANSWNREYTIDVHLVDDQMAEPDETFTLTLTKATGATLGDATATGTIVDDGDTTTTLAASDIEDTTATLTIAGHTDGWWYKGNAHACTAVAAGTTAVGIDGLTAVTDYEYTAYSDSACSTKLARVAFRTIAPEGTPTVSVSDAEVSEDGTWMQFWVSLSQPSREEVTVDVQTSDGTATGGSDYRAESQTLTFPANSRERQLLPVRVNDDQEREPDETFTVTLTNPVGATLGDATATGTIKDDGDTGAAGVALVSDPGDDATYAAGDAVRVAVTFSEAVAVDTEDGTPRLKLDLGGDDGTGERWALYEDGSGTETLTFAWTAAPPDESAAGVAVLADTLELNGGTIKSVATQIDVALGHPGRDPDPAHKVDAVAPRLVRGEIDGGTMRLYFSEALAPDSTGGKFLMAVETAERGVVGFDAAGGVTVEGAVVTVGMGERMPQATAGLDRNSMYYWRRADGSDGALRDPAGNLVAAPRKSRTTDGIAMRFFRTDLENVTEPATSVTGVEVVSDAGSDDTYVLDDTIRVQVTFSEPVEVTGTPRLKIDMDPAHWGEKWASYESGSGTGSLTFAHTVVQPNYSTQGIAVLANSLQLNGGTIRSDGADAELAHDGRPHDANHKVDWQMQPESGGEEEPAGQGGDDGPPAVTGVAVVSSPVSGHTYLLGETIRIRATFSEPVSVTGSPRISIDMDPAHWGTKRAAYASGGGTSSLDFVHTVAEPNYSTQGIAVLANSLALNGGAIRSAATNANAALGHTGLGHNSGHKVDWRPTISVADARADEGAGAKVAFEVSLSRAFTTAAHSVTVDYATADGTAKAGEDYTATSGTFTFAAGERTKTVNVPVLDDAIDEGEETFVLRLSNVRGARAGDLEATGTIANDDPLQMMWLSRLGRTVAGHVTDAVSDRLANPLAGAHVTVAGQRVDVEQTEDGAALTQALTAVARALDSSAQSAPGDGFASGSQIAASGAGGWPGRAMGARGSSALDDTAAHEVSGRELLLGSAFHLTREGEGGGPGLAAWGRVTVGGFDGEAPTGAGSMRIDGEVTTGILGADAEWNRLLAGVAVSLSEGEGTFSQPGVDSGKIESTMTAVSPYARFMVNDRISVWGLAGWGTGDMTITQAANENQPERITRTDIEMRLSAIGGRGALMQADETGGIDLGLRADAFYVETEAEAVSNEGGTTAVASRVRLALEGSRAFEMGDGVLTPGLELGLRHDGGDAETGAGVELGGRVIWADPGTGLSVEARVRTLIAHEDSDYREWGVSGAVRLAPGDRGRGLSFSLAPAWGAASGDVDQLWSAGEARGLAPEGDFEAGQRLEGELGYGFGLFGDRFTGTPNLGFGLSDATRDYRIGWRLTSAVRGDPGFEINLDATRRESANDNGPGVPAEHGVMLRGAIRW